MGTTSHWIRLQHRIHQDKRLRTGRCSIEEVEQVIASIQTVDQEIIDITKEALGSSKARRTLRNEINSDRVLISKLKTCIQRNTFNKSNEDLVPFASFYSVRVVIQDKLTKFALNQFHLGHPGIRRMKNLARLYFFWPKMDKDIELAVQKCAVIAL